MMVEAASCSGVPGNHDWYDGLDGFGRMFRRRAGRGARPSRRAMSPKLLRTTPQLGAGAGPWRRHRQAGGAGARGLHPGPERELLRAAARAAPGSPGCRSPAHDHGLAPEANCSVSTTAPDRTRPRSLLLPDPVYHFGDPSRTGTQMVESLRLDLGGPGDVRSDRRHPPLRTPRTGQAAAGDRGRWRRLPAPGPDRRWRAATFRRRGPASRSAGACCGASPGSWPGAVRASCRTSRCAIIFAPRASCSAGGFAVPTGLVVSASVNLGCCSSAASVRLHRRRCAGKRVPAARRGGRHSLHPGGRRSPTG